MEFLWFSILYILGLSCGMIFSYILHYKRHEKCVHMKVVKAGMMNVGYCRDCGKALNYDTWMKINNF